MAPPVEDYFPRGRAQTAAKPTNDKSVHHKKVDKTVYHKDVERVNTKTKKFVNLFNPEKFEEKSTEALKKKREWIVKLNEKKIAGNTVPSLKYSDLREGMVMRAVVAEVTDYAANLALPFHLKASLSIANISPIFTQLLRKAAGDSNAGEEEEMDDVPSMQQLFEVGQNLVVAIRSITKDEHDVYEVAVTLDPKLVMAGRVPDVGDFVVGMVKSKEDHGYIMDVGNEALTGFISHKGCRTLCAGMVVLCVVSRKIGNALTLQSNKGKIFTKDEKKNPNFQSLLPLTNLKVKVIKILENGLKVDFGDKKIGYIHKDLLDPMKSELDEYKIGNFLTARIVMEIVTAKSNTVMFQTRSVWPFTTTFKNAFGDIIEEAIVTSVMNPQLDLTLGIDEAGVVPYDQAQKTLRAGTMLKDAYTEGEKVRARVIYRDYFTGQCVCSLLKARVENPEIDGYKIGQLVQATVMDHQDLSVEFSVNDDDDVTAFARNVYLVDHPTENPQEDYIVGKEVTCKIIGIEPAGKRLELTAKPSQVNQTFKYLSCLDSIEVGDITLGVVGKLYPNGALIFLMNGLSGWITANSIRWTGKTPSQMFFLGETVQVKVIRVTVETERITLVIHTGQIDDEIPTKDEIGTKKDEDENKSIAVGTYCTAKVEEVTENGLEVESTYKGISTKCTVPSYHLTDSLTLANTLLNSYKVGDEIKAVCVSNDSKPVLSMKPLFYYTAQRCANYNSLRNGFVIAGAVKSIQYDMIEIETPIKGCKSCVVPFECITKPDDEDVNDILEPGQSLPVKVVKINQSLKQVIASANLMNGVMENLRGFRTVNYVQGVLGDLAFIRNRCSNEYLKKFRIGRIVDAEVKMVTDMGALLQITGREGDSVKALAPASNFGSCKPEPGSTIQVLVLFIDYQAEVLEVCCDQTLVELCSRPSRNFLKIGTKLTGDIVLTRTQLKLHIVAVIEPKEFKGNLAFIPDLEEDLVQSDGFGEKFNRRKVEVTAQIVTKRQEFICSNEELEDKKRGRDEVHEDESSTKKMKKEDEIKEEIIDDYVADDSIAVVEEEEAMDVKIDNVPTTTLPDPGWDVNATGVTLPQWGKDKVSMWGDDADSSDEEITEVSDQKSNKFMKKKERKRLAKEQEKIAEQQENKIVQGDDLPPQTEMEFERLVATSPDSSLVWIQYMAHFLQSCQYEKARGVAKKAVNRINFREEKEILNVYLAWLNMENVFGSPESLDAVLKEAVQRNDEYKVLTQMTEVFDKSSKFAEAEKVFKTLARKFRPKKEVWVRYGQFYFKNSRKEEGRGVFTRALQNLEVKEAADITSKFAQMEFNFGDTERGKTMYEKLVSTYPKRVDIWKSYTEQLTRIGDVDASRALFIRISNLGLQAKKMKPLFAKWLEFETTYGTEEQQGVVRAAALQYLNKKGASEPVTA